MHNCFKVHFFVKLYSALTYKNVIKSMTAYARGLFSIWSTKELTLQIIKFHRYCTIL